jgi:hypothetical protein
VIFLHNLDKSIICHILQKFEEMFEGDNNNNDNNCNNGNNYNNDNNDNNNKIRT